MLLSIRPKTAAARTCAAPRCLPIDRSPPAMTQNPKYREPFRATARSIARARARATLSNSLEWEFSDVRTPTDNSCIHVYKLCYVFSSLSLSLSLRLSMCVQCTRSSIRSIEYVSVTTRSFTFIHLSSMQ